MPVMSLLQRLREERSLSQRALAIKAGIAFRSVQLMESGHHNPRWSTVLKLGKALGVEPAELLQTAKGRQARETVRDCSLRIARDGKDSWKIHLMDFVDAFRRDGDAGSVAEAPRPKRGRPSWPF